MNCAWVRSRLPAFCAGELDVVEREAVAAHLGGCAGCCRERRREDAALNALSAFAADTPPVDGSHLWAGVAARLEPSRRQVRPVVGAWRLGLGGLMAAAAVAALWGAPARFHLAPWQTAAAPIHSRSAGLPPARPRGHRNGGDGTMAAGALVASLPDPAEDAPAIGLPTRALAVPAAILTSAASEPVLAESRAPRPVLPGAWPASAPAPVDRPSPAVIAMPSLPAGTQASAVPDDPGGASRAPGHGASDPGGAAAPAVPPTALGAVQAVAMGIGRGFSQVYRTHLESGLKDLSQGMDGADAQVNHDLDRAQIAALDVPSAPMELASIDDLPPAGNGQ